MELSRWDGKVTNAASQPEGPGSVIEKRPRMPFCAPLQVATRILRAGCRPRWPSGRLLAGWPRPLCAGCAFMVRGLRLWHVALARGSSTMQGVGLHADAALLRWGAVRGPQYVTLVHIRM
eukprot:COSAG01_NODE_1838_length_9083_cov_3.184328_9_plen_120_part_00